MFWFPLGFLVITAFAPRTKFTVADLCSDITPKIVEEMPFDLANSPRQLMLHMSNATPHRIGESITCLKKFRVRPINHPPYSLDLAPVAFIYLVSRRVLWAGENSSPQKNSFR
jgi:hypothetical protein